MLSSYKIFHKHCLFLSFAQPQFLFCAATDTHSTTQMTPTFTFKLLYSNVDTEDDKKLSLDPIVTPVKVLGAVKLVFP